MEYAYQRGEEGSFLIFETDQMREESFEDRMLAKAKLNKFLKKSVIEYDDSFRIRYEISGMQSVEKFYEERAIGREALFQLLWEIERAKKECHRFLLSESHFFFRPTLAYLNFKNDSCKFVYLSEKETDFSEEMMEMAEFILEKLDHQDEEAVEIAYELYERAGEENFVLRQFLEEKEKRGIEERNGENVCEEWEVSRELYTNGERSRGTYTDQERSGEVCISREAKKDVYTSEEAKWDERSGEVIRKMQFPELEEESVEEREKEEEGILKAFFRRFAGRNEIKAAAEEKTKREKTNYIEDAGEGESFYMEDTVWLDQLPQREEEREEPVLGELLPLGEEGERLPLNKDFILIGKAEGYVDGLIRNETVSRIHAEILREKGSYYIEDCNSKNGTRIDGEMLQPNERRKLEKGMRIGFGQSLFLFR